MISLRYYQREAVDATFNYFANHKGNPLIVLPTGAGKSLTMAAFIHEAINMYPATRILLLTHVKELIEQDAKAIINYWPEAPVGIWSASVGQKQKQQITVAGIQSIHRLPAKFADTDLIIVDECFTGETLISTPCGNKRIDGIKCGDLVHNALGSGIVEAISEKTSLSILKIGFNDGTFIRCTKNHPIFTTKGWVKAGCLEIGTSVFSRGDLLKLRETILPLDQEDGFRGNYKCSKREYLEKAKVLLNILLEEAQQPNARHFGQNEDARNAKTHTTPTDKAGREWASTSSSTTSITSCAWGGMDSRICGPNKKTPWNWVSNLLQIRHCKSIYKNWNRDRWPKSWVNGKNRTGQEEGSFIGRIRVESIEVEQPESNESVFNLRVSGHPSYFANGILVHNCHLVPRSGGTMYRKFLDALLKYNPAIKVIGLTATEYRTDSGLLVEGEDRVFTDIAYSANVGTLIKEGYLCPLVMKGGATKADLSGVHVRGGDYIPAEAQKAMNHDHLIKGALDEVAQFADDRKHILGFCAGVEHAQRCMQLAQERGWTANYVHGGMTPTQRDYIINSFKEGKIRFLFNANILTTGFDAPLVDCIIMLRPTKSTGLYVQIMGRGLRKHASKENTLVLDFVGAVALHGPIDAIVVKSKRKKGEATIGVAPVKECPKCHELIHASVMTCPGCQYEWPASAVHGTEAADGVIVAALAKPQRYNVDSVNYSLHMKDNRRSLKVEYWCGLKTFTEFLPVEDERSFVRKHAVAWFWQRGCTCPKTVEEALTMDKEGRIPHTKAVVAKLDGKYWRVIDAEIDFGKMEVAV